MGNFGRGNVYPVGGTIKKGCSRTFLKFKLQLIEKSERNCLSLNDLIFVVKRSVYRHSVVLGRDRCRFPININFYKHHGTDYYARVNQPSDCSSDCSSLRNDLVVVFRQIL